MFFQPVDRKRCASCHRWSGPRAPGDLPGTVAIESETIAGLCVGGPWDGQERRARSACGHWVVWLALTLVSTTGNP
ncbi:MAG: hypothetical protein IPL58_01075 [Betaproteobacteria bacterium]|jgi:hypothetical protein|uniref:Uncharacterized protein n=1 Tax=Candidatus Proximibacter danicus TaxID=2954365 RepID=A0A9D7JY06_9PROT|nr:hypothetical protein [Candidatus Proximibacter danicus]MBK9445482.1 hypothetical protein [Betaproteobacteria bacterium]